MWPLCVFGLNYWKHAGYLFLRSQIFYIWAQEKLGDIVSRSELNCLANR